KLSSSSSPPGGRLVVRCPDGGRESRDVGRRVRIEKSVGASLCVLGPCFAGEGDDAAATTSTSELRSEGALFTRQATGVLDFFGREHPASEQHLIEIHQLSDSRKIP